MSAPTERLYADLSSWWHLLSPPEKYTEESVYYIALVEQIAGAVASLLELGSGGGNLALWYPMADVTLVDKSEGMLEVSRSINPDYTHVNADITALSLGRTFDAVILHDAVMYLTSEQALRQTFQSAFDHLRPGGAFLLLPDCVKETWTEGSLTGSGMGEGRAAQMMEWHWDPDPDDNLTLVEFVFLLRENGVVRTEHETHTFGVFPRATYWRLLREVGFELEIPLIPSPVETSEIFLCRRPV